VPERFTDDWQVFTGGESTTLPMDAAALRQWWDALSR